MENLQELTFTLNGETVTARVEGRTSLLRYLRDDLGMIGTKDGCSSGDCGSCVVLVDGKPVDSCVYLMRRASGVRVETIEGLARDGTLHPIQAAFLDRGAVQCGFCIPGMIMASKALLERNPSPTPEEIRAGLKDNICRCTGFEPIFEAVQQASEWLAEPALAAAWKPTYGPIGTSSVLVDGTKSVRGQLLYADDMVLPGMLYGQVVWSEHAYARILSVDTKAAQAAPGVHRVLTAADVPGLNAHGRTVPDQPVLCSDYVRFTGDPIAVVLADTRDHAAEAAALVHVEYEPLQGLFDPKDSLKPDAPQLVSSSPGNVCKALTHEVGDVAAAFATAAHVVEGHFKTQRQDHAYLEPLVALAEVVRDGTVTVYVPTQAPFETREQLSRVLDLPRDKIRIIATPLGGAFGGKLEIAVEAIVAVAAYVTRKPVKITLSRAESLATSVKRHPFELDYRVAADTAGRLLAVDATLVCDGGPYTGNSPRVIDQACIFSCGPYRVPNVRIDGKAVLTNNPLGGAFRGYGINQAAVAMEQLMDELALELAMDPFELRRVNMLVEGDETITGQLLPSSVGALPTLDACRAAFEEEWPHYRELARPGYRVGYGVASGFKNVGAGKGKIDDAGALFALKANGRVELRASVVDMGQAIRTTMVQLASQATGLDFGIFDIITQDTALTHPHRSASGQRQTLVSGNAVVIAGKQFKDVLLGLVAGWTGRTREEVTIVGNEVRSQWSQYTTEERLMTLAEIYDRARSEGIAVSAEAEYIAPRTWPLSDKEARRTVPREEYRNYPTYAYATQVAIVGVDEATGQVDVLRVIAAHDVGVAINPQQIRGQLIGSVSMGQGLALSENYPSEGGRPPWRRLDYRRLGVPTSLTATSVRVEIVEDPFPEGPYGAKGISEIATVPSTPAILNAIHHATGVRPYEIPVSPKLLRERMLGQAAAQRL
ncbi:MAG: molybdopterin-dependent oxidoreductase [Candidatus Limnocylindrales bacterium]|nr:molybdopterin-dependent oxidoreductase [Candidatus Limnocylindrales bacterium]